MEVFLGIDLGTSCVKAAFLDGNGEIKGLGSADINLSLPEPGFAEQDPREWWDGARIAIAQAAEQCRGAGIKGVGISGQMCGSVLLDKEGNLIDQCIIWLDQRAERENEEVKNILGMDTILDVTANYPLVSLWTPKLLWLRRHKPAVYGKIAHVLFPKDYLKWKLTGVLDIDVTDAPATGLFNTAKRTWEDDIFTKLDIDRSFVPAGASESTDIIGYVTAEAAEFLGIPKGIPVVGGGGDQMCGACGLGVVDTGIVSSTIGTSGCVFSYSPHCVIDRKPRALLSYCHSVPGSWCVFGCTLMSGGSLRWLRDTMMPGAGYDEMTALAEKAQPGSEGLVFLPYLNGERTPHPDPNARGVFFGLSARHGRGELIRSVMEGVAYSLCDTVGILREQNVPVSEIRAAGGGAVSPLWRQIQADIFRTTVVTTNVVESPATGAAMMAAVGAGSFSSLKEASDAVVRITSRTEPNDFNMRVYEDYYETYRALYDSLQPHFTAQARKVERWNDKSN